MTAGLPPPPPPPPAEGSRRRPRWLRVLRALALGALTGLAAALALSFAMTASIGPPPAAADVCHGVPAATLSQGYQEVTLGLACNDVDTDLGLPLGGPPTSFEAIEKAPNPPAEPTTAHPGYLVWETDGCSAPVLGRGPFDFTLACTRHDFGWRNLKALNRAGAPVWHVGNKDRVDAGFLWDMRSRCAAFTGISRLGCDTTARVYYTAVRLNPSGVSGLPGRSSP
jgi:hypothetical protein